jgi:hypothetical protein
LPPVSEACILSLTPWHGTEPMPMRRRSVCCCGQRACAADASIGATRHESTCAVAAAASWAAWLVTSTLTQWATLQTQIKLGCYKQTFGL